MLSSIRFSKFKPQKGFNKEYSDNSNSKPYKTKAGQDFGLIKSRKKTEEFLFK